MATSKSADPSPSWIGGASVFAGRPDPSWTVDENIAGQLLKIWDALEPSPTKPPVPPPLGYRGSVLKRGPSREWQAYGGVVTLKTNDYSESRRDVNQDFEKLLLSSAPEGTLPPIPV